MAQVDHLVPSSLKLCIAEFCLLCIYVLRTCSVSFFMIFALPPPTFGLPFGSFGVCGVWGVAGRVGLLGRAAGLLVGFGRAGLGLVGAWARVLRSALDALGGWGFALGLASPPWGSADSDGRVRI